MEFNGARVLITGGSEGIGRSLAEKLIAEGAKVGITGRRAEVLEAAAETLGALPFQGDVSVQADVERVVAGFKEAAGGIDVLVNNAGIGYGDLIQDIDVDKFHHTQAVNVTGPMLMMREVAPLLIAQSSGHVVNVSSTAGLKGFARGTAYCASKFALKGMTECWRDELRKHNVRVVLINPSEVQTKWGGRDLSNPNPRKLFPEDIADAIIGVLRIDDRGFVPEFPVFATNPF